MSHVGVLRVLLRESVVGKARRVALPDQVDVAGNISSAILVDITVVLTGVIAHNDHRADILLGLVGR
jgi:hypothetical protein